MSNFDLSNVPYFIFNNVNSRNLGILVKELPPITKAEKDIETINLKGTNKTLHIDYESYKSKTYKITCILTDESKIDLIKKTFDSIGIFEVSTEPDIKYNACICNQIDFSKYLKYLKEFILIFELDPIGYKDATSSTFTQSTSDFDGHSGNVDTYPTITITGIGTITLNNCQIQVLETGITIDCELMNCTKNGLNKNDKVICDDFPVIHPGTGSNNITFGEGITQVVLSTKAGYL